MAQQYGGFLQSLATVRDAKTGRLSSWDQSGKNQDYWLIGPGESVTLADIQGAGCITHIWMTQFCRRVLGASVIDPKMGQWIAPVNEIHNALGVCWEVADPHYYRKVLIKMYWDNAEEPSVVVPLGDFFCIGHSMPGNINTLPINISTKPEERYKFGGSAALNCFFPMPFNTRAVIEIENQNDIPYGQYFYIDYEMYTEEHKDDIAYFHANWKRANPCNGWGPELQTNSPEVNISTLSAEGNYEVLNVEGEGHYVGCNLSVAHFQGSWWGEGDDMIFVDDDTWPPSIHGTGTEDYFNHAWGMQDNAGLYNGTALHESIVPGFQTSYKFHITEPVHFKKRIRVTIEHGHANHLCDDWASTAYWYQKKPGAVTIQPLDERIPTTPGDIERRGIGKSTCELTAEQQMQKDTAKRRFEEFMKTRQIEIEAKLKATREKEAGNKKHAQFIARKVK
ncbi:TPA: DUF2961 domain-containing protein [Klebsiella michiganensis]|uniref:glycoside hydrolase family 172 protein n=1 Tax=Klebsiella michiganensis TaxID=1134687 RepID=UPI0028919A83|nr:DUF2961 domain-containing protein [Klebsiella michiganensis]